MKKIFFYFISITVFLLVPKFSDAQTISLSVVKNANDATVTVVPSFGSGYYYTITKEGATESAYQSSNVFTIAETLKTYTFRLYTRAGQSSNYTFQSSKTYFYENLRIKEIEQIPYFCGTRVNVLLENSSTAYSNMQFASKIGSGVWSGYQSSSTFSFDKDILASGLNLNFRVKYNVISGGLTNEVIETATPTLITFVSQDVTYNYKLVPPNCGDTSGSFEATIDGGWRYLKFNGVDTYVEIPSTFLNNLPAFTMEGDVRFNGSIPTNTEYVGVFGIDNVLEFGLRKGKPGAYIHYTTATGTGTLDKTSGSLMPDDNQWHNMVVRSDGTKIEILVDGNLQFYQTCSFLTLSPDAAGVKYVTIGAKVWNSGDKGINGDISRVSFWSKYLTNDELAALRKTEPTSASPNLLAAYYLKSREDGVISAIIPNGVAEIDKPKYKGVIHNALWSDMIEYTLKKENGATYVLVSDPSSKKAFVGNLDAGKYKFAGTYNAGECNGRSEVKEFILSSTSINPTADVIVTANNPICEGENITFNIQNITGVKIGETPTYKWELKKNGVFETIIGATSVPYTNKVIAGDNEFQLNLDYHTCIGVKIKVNEIVKASTKIKTSQILKN